MSPAHSITMSFLLAATAVAQPGSFVPFGSGCSGSLGIPSVTGTAPNIGQSFTLTVSNTPGPTIVLFGASNAVWLGGLLPFSFTPFGATGCDLLVSTEVSVITAPIGGTAQLVLNLPVNPVLIGGQFYNQGLIFDPLANQAGLTSTNGGCATIGDNVVITGASNQNPLVGEIIVVTGTGFGQNSCCVPGFAPLGPPVGGQVQLRALNIPGLGVPFELEASNFTSAVALGQGGQAFASFPGVTASTTAIGNVGTLPTGTQAGQGITMTINANPSPRGVTQLPVSIDGQGRICIDFTGTSWTGTEKLEIELHFDITGTATHCDFFAIEMCFTSAGTPQQCALTAALWIALNLAILPNCAGVSVLAQGNTVYPLAPPPGKFTNLHPFSHVCIQ